MIKLLFLLLLVPIQCWCQAIKISLPLGHTRNIESVDFILSNTRIISSSQDNSTKEWDVTSGALLANFEGELVAMAADENEIATTGTDEDVVATIWNLKTGASVITLRDTAPGEHIISKFSNDSRLLYMIDRDTSDHVYTDPERSILRVWDVMSGVLLKRLIIGSDSIRSYAKELFTSGIQINKIGVYKLYKDTIKSSSGQMYCILNNKYVLIVNKSNNRHITLSGHTGIVQSANFTLDGKWIATSSEDGTVKIWDTQTGELNITLNNYPNAIQTAKFSTDNTMLAAILDDNSIKIWNTGSGILLTDLKGHANSIANAYFSKSGSKLIISGEEISSIWDTKTLSPIKHFIGSAGDNTVNVISADENLIAILKDDTTTLYNILSIGHKGTKFPGEAPVLSPDSRQIATAVDGRVILYDLLHGHKTIINSGEEKIGKIIFSPDGKYIYTGASMDWTCKLWNVQTGKMISKVAGYNPIFNPQGREAIITTEINDPIVVNPLAGNRLHTLHTYSSSLSDAIFSKDGKKAITIGGGGNFAISSVWNTYNYSKICNLGSDLGLGAFNNKVDRIALAHQNIVSIQSLSGKQISILRGHDLNINSIDFSSDDKKLLTADEYAVKIWDIKSAKEVCTLFCIDTNGFLIKLPDGYYRGDVSAVKLLHYTTADLRVIGFGQLDIKYNRPDKVLEAIGCPDTGLIQSYRKAYQKRIKKLGIDTTSFRSDYSIPEADFVNRDALTYEQKSDTLRLHIHGNDSIHRLDRFNIWVNESPVFGIRGVSIRSFGKYSIDTTIIVSLSNGKNTIETSVINVNGIESYRKPLVVNYTPAQPTKEKLYFIGIGIDHFADSSHNLRYCTKDIRDLADALKTKYGTNCNIITLTNEQVNVASIARLKDRLRHTSINDKVLIAYSGHGLVSDSFDYYLSTYNVSFTHPEMGGLPYEALEDLLDGIPARKKLLLIDACHSGELDKEEWLALDRESKGLESAGVYVGSARGIPSVLNPTKSLGSKNTFELMQSLFVNVGRSTGAEVICAAAGTQFAIEENGNGVFTYCILETLKTQPHITLTELKQRVSARVTELTKGLQLPNVRSEPQYGDWQVW